MFIQTCCWPFFPQFLNAELKLYPAVISSCKTRHSIVRYNVVLSRFDAMGK
ncbi:hypothetical protein BaRGS_00038778, partial [Batillaria attramentaria]